MLHTIAVRGYRSLREIVLPLRRLTVVTGANGTGKSSLYRALRLLADCGRGEVIGSLAREGGLDSVLWAGPEQLGGARRTGRVEGTTRTGPVALELGFASDDFGYLVDLGLPQMAGHGSLFALDPEIKREVVFAGAVMRTGSDPGASHPRLRRGGRRVRARLRTRCRGRCPRTAVCSPNTPTPAPTQSWRRSDDRLRTWRFYDGFRVDATAPSRLPQVGTRTPVLSDDGRDVAAAVQTIIEAGFDDLSRAVAEAFDGASVSVAVHDGLFDLQLHQRGMLRPLRAAELSDGTLRFLLWAAALLSPQPPSLMVLNEPETSLHPDLLRPLASLIAAAANLTQVVVVTHSKAMLEFLGTTPVADADDDIAAVEIPLYKELGETRIEGLGMLTTPPWDWGKR